MLSVISKRKQGNVSASDIRRSYSSEKARSDLVAQLWLYLVLRPVSFRLTPIFINLGISANTATVLGLIPLLCGLVLILLGATSPLNFIVGAFLVNIWYLCDCIDGNIARFQGQVSNFGALFDWMIGMFYHVFLPVCLGLGLYFASFERTIFDFGLTLPGWFWLLAGAVELFAGLFREAISMKAQKTIGSQVAFQLDAKISFWTILPRAILSFKAPLLLVASLLRVLGIWLFFYAVYNILTFVGMILLALRKALLSDRVASPDN